LRHVAPLLHLQWVVPNRKDTRTGRSGPLGLAEAQKVQTNLSDGSRALPVGTCIRGT